MENGHVVSGIERTGAEEKVVLRESNALLQTHINFPRFLPIFPDFLERLSHLAPIY
jgi:hypothetical protein